MSSFFSCWSLFIFSIITAICNMCHISVTTLWFNSIWLSPSTNLDYGELKIIIWTFTLSLYLKSLRKKWASFLVHICFFDHSLSLCPPRTAPIRCCLNITENSNCKGNLGMIHLFIHNRHCPSVSEKELAFGTRKTENTQFLETLFSFICQHFVKYVTPPSHWPQSTAKYWDE